MPLTMVWGTNRDFTVTVTNPDNSAYNLAGASKIIVTAKRSLLDDDTSAVFQLQIGTGVTIDNSAGGIFHFSVTPTELESLNPGLKTILNYDVKLIDTTGKEYPLISPDTLTISPAVTHTI